MGAPPKKEVRTVEVDCEQYVSFTVTVDLGEIPTEDLVDELAERDGTNNSSLSHIYELMSLGKREDAYEAMREYVQDVTGRLLP